MWLRLAALTLLLASVPTFASATGLAYRGAALPPPALAPCAAADLDPTIAALDLGSRIAALGLDATISPAEANMLAAAERDGIRRADLLDAALLAAGVHEVDRRRTCQAIFERHALGASRAAAGLASDSQRARILLAYCHAHVLRTYDARASSPAAVLNEGRFNCLGATIVFLALAPRAGLDASAILLPGHVACQVETERGPMRIETTLPDAQPVAGAGRLLDDRGLVALVYYNRALELLAMDRHPQAVAANAHALRLDPRYDAARANLAAALNQWAIALSDGGQWEAALSMIECAARIAPEQPLLAANQAALERMLHRARPDAAANERHRPHAPAEQH